MVARASLDKSPVGNANVRYHQITSRGLASAVQLAIHRRPEMIPPIAAKDARIFNGIAYSLLLSRKGTFTDSARFHRGPRCDQFLHLFSTYPLFVGERCPHNSAATEAIRSMRTSASLGGAATGLAAGACTPGRGACDALVLRAAALAGVRVMLPTPSEVKASLPRPVRRRP
jgi:hypothetical protein